jgi:hypothetical protein
MMSDCEHREIQTWFFEDGDVAGTWSCVSCGHRFVPIAELMAAEAERDAALATVARYETLRPANEWKGEHALLFHASKKHPVSLRTAGDEGMPFPGGNWRWLPIPDVKEKQS